MHADPLVGEIPFEAEIGHDRRDQRAAGQPALRAKVVAITPSIGRRQGYAALVDDDQRSASPSRAMPISARLAKTSRRICSGARAPQSRLMLIPSGERQ